MRDKARDPVSHDDHIRMLDAVAKQVLAARKTAKDGGADPALLSILDATLLAIGDRLYKSIRL